MKWTAYYSDKSEYDSDNYKWRDLPSKGFIKLIIILPAGGKMQVSGWDFYSLKELSNGLRISYWKDTVANDINGKPIEEPYLNKGGFREFYNDGTANGVNYFDADKVYKGIAKNNIKAGIWIPDELAREMGIL